MVEWIRQRTERIYRPGEGHEAKHSILSETLLRLIREVPLRDRTILDVGCGNGRLTFALAKEAGRIIGIDWSDQAIEQATQRARTDGLDHVTFICGDAERIDYGELGPIDLVVAHLCMSDEILRRAAAALPPGGCIAFSTLHKDQWQESGRSSRFAYGEQDAEAALAAAGFDPVYLGVERETLSFAAATDALAYLEASDLVGKWKADSRWEGFLAYLERGGRSLTVRARVTVKGRRR
jgi:2-polyprenyl-3-methyl-5-hydroxy-6-metoxy-1,4-benzoquinol methylase